MAEWIWNVIEAVWALKWILAASIAAIVIWLAYEVATAPWVSEDYDKPLDPADHPPKWLR